MVMSMKITYQTGILNDIIEQARVVYYSVEKNAKEEDSCKRRNRRCMLESNVYLLQIE